MGGLKNGNLDGFKFRRQHAIEIYIVDFFCAEANLVIEVDGSVHEGNEEQDAYRQGILETSGFRVLRFKNEQVERDIAGVRQAIREALTNGPDVDPSPSGMERGAGRRGEVESLRSQLSLRGTQMPRLRVKFTFPPEQIKEPVIYEVGKRFDLVTNVRRADITAEVAWAVLELDGTREDLDRGVEWLRELGIRVDPVEDSIIEG